MAQPSQAQLETWIAQLQKELVELDKFWTKLPVWVGVVLAVSIAAMIYKPLFGVLAFLLGLSFVGTAAWILGVRRREHREDLAESQERLSRLYG